MDGLQSFVNAIKAWNWLVSNKNGKGLLMTLKWMLIDTREREREIVNKFQYLILISYQKENIRIMDEAERVGD